MRISELARRVELPAATIRFYEEEGLIDKPARSTSNYRHYGADAIRQFEFIRQCRSLGIGLPEIKRLVTLAKTPAASCGEVDDLLDAHIAKVREQRRALAKLERNLKALRADCHPSKTVKGCAMLRGPMSTERRAER